MSPSALHCHLEVRVPQWSCLGSECFSRETQLLSCGAVRGHFVRPCLHSYCLICADGNWSKISVCTGSFVCPRVWAKEKYRESSGSKLGLWRNLQITYRVSFLCFCSSTGRGTDKGEKLREVAAWCSHRRRPTPCRSAPAPGTPGLSLPALSSLQELLVENTTRE